MSFSGDTLFSRAFEYQPAAVVSTQVDSLIDAFAEHVGRSSFASAPTAARAAQWARASLYTPPYHPPVSELVIGRDGSAWLREPVAGEVTVNWMVLAPNGEPLGVAALPSQFTLLLADRGTAYGMEQDELDVPYIVRYRVEN